MAPSGSGAGCKPCGTIVNVFAGPAAFKLHFAAFCLSNLRAVYNSVFHIVLAPHVKPGICFLQVRFHRLAPFD
jgi:hypothetical protein